MAWVALNCPQCSAPLPRVAIWRSVKCGSCGALITRTESIVTRDSFRQALVRSGQDLGVAVTGIQCGGQRYQLMQLLGSGKLSEVYLARRMGLMPFLATVKLSSSPAASTRYAREAQTLRELQTAENDAAGVYALHRLPEVVTQGPVDGAGSRYALVLRYPNGYWGSLADLNARFSQGIDPRHAVWIWRRLLDVLHFVHAQGWSHGDVRPEHALVHPQDHAVRLISWGSAQKGVGAGDQAKDLLRSARVAQVLVSGIDNSGAALSRTPAALAELIKSASQDEKFCRAQGAQGLDNLLRAAAQEAFGPPSFVPLNI
jgi:serine/threonine protein kinase